MRVPKKVLLLIILVVVGALACRPGLKAFRSWRADRLLVESREYTEAGNWEEGHRTALASYQISKSVEALRLLFEAMHRERDLSALQCGVGLFNHPEGTPADRRRVIEVVLDYHDLLLAVQLLQSLGVATETDPGLARLRLRAHLAMGQWARARALAAKHVEGEESAAFELQLAEGLGRSGRPEFRTEVIGTLSRLLRQPGRNEATQALGVLADLPPSWISPEIRAQAIQRFAGDDGLDAPAGLALALLRLQDRREDRATVIAQMITSHRNDLSALVAWLVRAQAWEEVVALTAESTLDGPTFNHRISALHRLQRYDELEQALKEPPVAISEALLLAARAALASQQGRGSEAVDLWQRAFKAAEQNRTENLYYRIAAIARQAKERDRAMEALARAIEHPRGIPPVAQQLEDLFGWLHANNKGKRFLAITFRLLQREPANPVLVNNYHYLRAMHDDPSVHSADSLRVLVQSFPDQPTFRGSLALVLLRTGEAAEALATLEALGSDPEKFAPTEKAIYCAALTALLRQEEALRLAAGIDWAAFPNEEADVFRALIEKELPGAAQDSPRPDDSE